MSSRARTEVGRYALHDEIASGGMATVHLGRLKGPVGFTRTVAIKRLHPQFAKDPDFVSMFLDEARLAARIRHPHVVPTLDVVSLTGELFLVMEYIHGISLQRMMKLARELKSKIPVDVACGIAVGALRGLHAAHEAKSEKGKKLDIVHRDVSPQNVMVGVDGLARVLDFGVAKASWRIQTTRQGQVKGKVSYMAPEQVMGGTVGPWTDVHALGIVLWEVLTGERLFPVTEERGLLARFTKEVEVAPPSALNPDVPPELDAAVLLAVAHDQVQRQPSAQVMADQIEAAVQVASSSRIGRFVQQLAEEELMERATRIAEIEGGSVVSVVTSAVAPMLQMLEAARIAEQDTKVETPTKVDTATEPMAAPPVLPEDGSKISMTQTLGEGLRATLHPKHRRTTLTAGIALLAFTALAVLLIRARTAAPNDLTLTASTQPQPAAAVAAASPEASAEAREAPSAPPVRSAAPAASSDGVFDLKELPVEVPSAAPTSKSKAPAPRKAVARRKAEPPAWSCNPPYTVDSRGIRRLKMQCVE